MHRHRFLHGNGIGKGVLAALLSCVLLTGNLEICLAETGEAEAAAEESVLEAVASELEEIPGTAENSEPEEEFAGEVLSVEESGDENDVNPEFTYMTDDGFLYRVSEDLETVRITGYWGDDVDITIPDEIGGRPVTTIASRAFYYEYYSPYKDSLWGLQSITLNANLKTIEKEAFGCLGRLQSITLNDGLETIGYHGLYDLERVKYLSIPGSVGQIDSEGIALLTGVEELRIENGDAPLDIRDDTIYWIGKERVSPIRNYFLEKVFIGDRVVNVGENAMNSWGLKAMEEIVVDPGNQYYRGTDDNTMLITRDGTKLLAACNLNNLTVPDTVQWVTPGALSSCVSVEWIAYEGPIPTWGVAGSLLGNGSIPDTAYLYYNEKYPEWKTTAVISKPEELRWPITQEMREIKAVVSAIDMAKLSGSDYRNLVQMRKRYEALEFPEQFWVGDEDIIDNAISKSQGLLVREIVESLPSASDITIKHGDDILEAWELYGELDKQGMDAMGAAAEYKLQQLKLALDKLYQVRTIRIEGGSSVRGAVGTTKELTFTVTPDYAKNKKLLFQSEDRSVVQITEEKTTDEGASQISVKLVGPGGTRIVASAADDGKKSVEVPVTSILPAPKNVKVTQLYNGSVEITWDRVDGCTEYKIYRSENGGPEYFWTSTGADVLEATDTGMSGGVHYSYRVVAAHENRNYDSEKSAEAGVTINMGTPLNVSASGSGKSILVSWSPVPGAASYQVYRRVAGKDYSELGTTSQTQWQDATVSAGITYTYKIRAVGSDGTEGGFSAEVSELLPLTAPGGVSVSGKAEGTVTVKWKAVSGAKSYEVQRSDNGGKTFKKLAEVTKVSYMDKKAKKGKEYQYRVCALASASSAGGAFSSAAKILIPDKAKISSAKKAGNNKAMLKWKKTAGATGYEIYRSTSKKSGYKKVKTVSKGTTLTYTDKKASGKTVYYKIRAYWKKNGVTVCGAYSSVLTVKMKK